MPFSKALANLEFLAQNANQNSFKNEHERRKAVQLVQKLLANIETPWETASRLLLIDPFAIAALRTLVNLQLFSKWIPADSPKSLAELAQLTSCDSRLLCECSLRPFDWTRLIPAADTMF